MAGTEKRGSTEPRNTVTIGVTTQDSTSVWRELGLRSGTRQCQRVQVAKPVAASHDPSMDDAAFDNALIAAAFQLAAEQGWRRVSVVAAARAAGLPLARARERFPGRSAILLRFGRLADQAALAEAPSEGLYPSERPLMAKAPVERSVQPDGTVRLHSGRCSFTFSRPRPGATGCSTC